MQLSCLYPGIASFRIEDLWLCLKTQNRSFEPCFSHGPRPFEQFAILLPYFKLNMLN